MAVCVLARPTTRAPPRLRLRTTQALAVAVIAARCAAATREPHPGSVITLWLLVTEALAYDAAYRARRVEDADH